MGATRNLRKVLPVLLALIAITAGCRIDMHMQPYYRTMAKSDFFADDRSARMPVEGTVAQCDPREDAKFCEDPYFHTGKIGNAPGDYLPFPVTAEVLARGRERFNINCTPCHGRVGDGNGFIPSRGFRRPPSYHIDRLRKVPIGYFFDVMTNGFGVMPEYGTQVAPRDRWCIAAYIRNRRGAQMTTATMNKPDLMAPPVAQTMQQRSLVIGAIAAIASVAGAYFAPESFYSAYLTGFMFWLGLSLGCMAILMLYHLVGGAWGTVIRRILEAGMMTLPLMFVLFIPILLNLPKLYFWARPGLLADPKTDPKILEIAHSYLNFNGILLRYILYFAIWFGMAYFLNRWSTEQDSIAGQTTLRFRAMSSIGLVIYSLTISFAVIDWVMSLQARWISTIYGLLFVAGEALSAFCFCVVIESILGKRKPMSEYLTDTEVHDHGKFMLTFVMVWAYFNFSQWLIIWAGNLPEEIPWYVRRMNGGWEYVGLFLVVFHFAVPFALLLSRQLKRKARSLVWLASGLIIMRIVDIFWHIEPASHPTFHVSWVHFAIIAGIGGLWMTYFFHNLRARPLLAVNAPQTLRLLEPSHE